MHGPDDTFEGLAEDLIGSQLSGAHARELSRTVQENPEARCRLAGALLVHGLLAGRDADADLALAAIRARIADPRRDRAPVIPWRRRFIAAAALAASVLLAVGAILHLVRPPGVRGPSPVARLVSGHLDGAPSLLPGELLATTDAAAELECDDGCLLRIEPRSSARLRGASADERCRVELAAGAVQCTVTGAPRPMRVVTSVVEVVTEGTQFGVRLSEPGGSARGVLVRVTDGTVRMERAGELVGRVAANEVRVFPPPSGPEQAVLALSLLFPGEPMDAVQVEHKGTAMDIEARSPSGEVEAVIAEDGVVLRYSRELAASSLPQALPEAVRAAVQAKFGPALEWLKAEVGFSKGVEHYELEVRARGGEHEVHLDAAGRFIQEEDD